MQHLYQIYIQIGGYPEVVKRYRDTENTEACYGVIGRLLDTFKEESRNYFTSPRETELFEIVYREAFKEMCREKKGTGKNIVERVTTLVKANTDAIVKKSEISNAVVWLKYTGILGTCSLANEGNIKNIIPDRRIYYMDCGIASYIGNKYTMEPSAVTGLLEETFVYNELHRLFSVPFDKRRVKEDEVCFSVFHSYEMDFMMTDRENTVYGIEVKAKDGEPQSLKVFVDKKFVGRGIVLKQTRGGRSPLFDTIPIYTAGCRFPYLSE